MVLSHYFATLTMPPNQIDLFEHIAGAFAQTENGRLTNADLYRMAAGRAGISKAALEATSPIGKAGEMRSPVKQRIKWGCQDLKALGLVRRVDGERGVWELTEEGNNKLRKIRDDVSCLAYSTDLGIAIWSDAHRVFSRLRGEPIFLALTSPPYPLKVQRAYSAPTSEQHIGFICHHFEPVVRELAPGGSIVLNVGDVFEDHSPAKSTYIEELTLAMKKRFGLHLMNRIIWQSNKPPGPVQWASKKRVQLNEGYEFCLWFTNDPQKCHADNRRVLEPHTERHKAFVEKGGIQVARVNGDGAHRQVIGAYSRPTDGRIPRNIWQIGNRCDSQRAYKARAREIGLAAHGAAFPLELARKLIRFLTEVGQLVVDLFSGSNTTGLAAELEGRPWISTEIHYDYARGSGERFRDFPGFELVLA